jgi:hypothetical protein
MSISLIASIATDAPIVVTSVWLVISSFSEHETIKNDVIRIAKSKKVFFS